VLLILVAFLLICGTMAVGQIPVTVTITGVDAPGEPSVVGQGYYVRFEVVRAAANPSGLNLYGTIVVDDGEGNTCSRATLTGTWPDGWTWGCTLTTYSAGTKTLTATFTPLTPPADFGSGSGTGSHTVNQAATTVAVTSSPDPSVVGETVTLTATVTVTSPGSGSPTGTVTFKNGTTVLGAAPLVGSGTSSSQAVFTTAAIPAGTHTLTAQYLGSADYSGSSGTDSHTVSKRQTVTTVFVSDTPLVVNDTATGTVVVQGVPDNYLNPPTGTVTLSYTGNGTLTPTSHTLTAAEGGRFEFTYAPSDAATTPHVITASYAGDTVYNTSSDTYSQAVEKRSADVVMTVSPATAYIAQAVTVTIHIADRTTAGTAATPTGTVTFSDGGENGVFSLDTASLSGGACTVTYTPGAWDAGISTLTATYAGSDVHEGASASEELTVELRPTKTTVTGSTPVLVVRQPYTFTVTVADIAPAGTASSPTGSLAYSSQLPAGDVSLVPGTGTAPAATFEYTCLGLDNAGAYDIVMANYTPDDGIHARSDIPTDLGAENNVAWGQAVKKRPTVTAITLPASTATGVTFTAGASEHPANPTPLYPLTGNLHLLEPSTLAPVGPATPFVVNWPTPPGAPPLVNVTVMYEPSDRVHLPSTASTNIDRSSWFDPIVVPPNPADYDQCTDGCGTGGTDIENAIYALNATEVALEAVKSGLEVVALVLDIIPDPVTAAGCVVVGGATIPVSDIAKAVVAGAGIALDIAILAMDTDLDDDGLPDVIEETITHTNPFKVDSDGDGMGDLDEIDEAGGFYGGTRRPSPNDADSDDDGISDGDESNLSHTNFCVADSDCDTVSDGVEYSTGYPYTGLPAPSTDIRDQADPLMLDTDGDGLSDALEIAYGCPYVNDDDSDNDGLQDGHEDANHNGTIINTLGTSVSQGSGETNFCLADTDGDGLLDGEEEGQFGTSVTPKGVSATVGAEGANLGVTIPALDTDMDNDLLSDAAETNQYQTDPTDADTDNDTLADGFEVATWSNGDARNHSNPREADTDGDGLTDNLEVAIGCPFVNDDDSDDDGLQDGYEDRDRDGVIEIVTIGSTGTVGNGETDFCDPDTDNDGLLDGEEEALFGQGPRSATTLAGVVTTVPALDDDSDDDGLSDFEEVDVTHTDPLDWDTDNDTLSDLNELIATGGTWPMRTFRQVSDPLDPDTDDDGLPDNVEYTGTGLGTSHGTGGTDDLTCTYVNDADSDDDGLQDGVEDANHDGKWLGITIGSFTTQASRSGAYWETDPCNPDTDGDGLLDGEEATLLGGGPITGRPADWPNTQPAPGFNTVTPEGRSIVGPVGPNYSGMGPLYTFTPTSGPGGTATVPALDVDTDNDGLSDYEEVNTTGTNPLDADSDNDTLADADELVATGGVAGAHPQRSFDQESDPLDINTDDDYLFDPVEGSCGAMAFAGTGLSVLAGALGGARDTLCPLVNNADSDDDGVKDGAVIPIQRQGPGMTYSYTFLEAFVDVPAADIQAPGTVRTVVTPATGEQDDDSLCNVCDSDSDGDGLTDGQEIAIGTDPQDWDTDDDGRSDWHEVTGGGPIPTDPFDPDTDDDGLLDSAEVFGTNPTNPVNADTDGDGLCDGGAGTPYMVSGHPTVTVNPICKSCSQPGNTPCGTLIRSGSPDGIGDHPNPMGRGEDENGNGTWDTGETDPNQFDTDGDAEGDGIEVLGFSTPRQSMIPATDLFGRPILVVYPDCGCLDPLNPDTDGDGLSDGIEDLNHDGNFDFASSDFDFDVMPLLGPPHPDPEETNPCDPDTDHDLLTDDMERLQPNPAAVYPFNPTNPLDHDTDNDWLTDGYEVFFTCTTIEYTTLDNDLDGRIDEDPVDGSDNDGDGLIDEDPVDFTVRSVPVLDPTNRDSDSDGFIDGLDEDPCNSELIPILFPALGEPADSDGDGFADIDEQLAGTSEYDPEDHPVAFGQVDLDFDECIDDRIWLEPFLVCCQPVDLASAVTIDLDNNVLIDLRLTVLARNVTRGDFDGDSSQDDVRYVIEYLLSNYRAIQAKIVATINDYDGDLVIDRVVVERK
jgi:hypothetical protein